MSRTKEGKQEQRDESKSVHVLVAVLGDVGRSPRMQYHALSLVEQGHTVSLVGYSGEDLIPSLQQCHGELKVFRFSPASPKFLRRLLPIYYLFRTLSLVANLIWALYQVSTVNRKPVACVLMQNPPAVPLLLVSYLYCRFAGFWNGTRPGLVIDWHNIGSTMFAPCIFRRLTEKYERLLAPRADGHLCVTAAMRNYLLNEKYVQSSSIVRVLYDCPPSLFKPLSLQEQHEFLARVQTTLFPACPAHWYNDLDLSTQTLFTERTSSGTHPRKGRPCLVTSSTSWTEDEDFEICFSALVKLDRMISENSSSLKVLVVVTGKGPMQTTYEAKISKLTLQHVAIQCVWLEPVDYPRLLACADLGISLHTSTSGLDLPMKILDLFGCQVPVCAFMFDCIDELVKDNVNGRTFETSDALAGQLWSLLSDVCGRGKSFVPHGHGDLERYSRNLQGVTRWSENWKANALPTLVECLSH